MFEVDIVTPTNIGLKHIEFEQNRPRHLQEGSWGNVVSEPNIPSPAKYVKISLETNPYM